MTHDSSEPTKDKQPQQKEPSILTPGEIARARDAVVASSVLTPGEIARARDAVGAAQDYLQDTMKTIEADRSGQLSPSHTPGRSR